MKESFITKKIDINKSERFKKALNYLTYKGFIKSNEELSKKKILAYSNISRAKNGDPRYLTAGLFERLCEEYRFFNLDFFLTGEGSMLREGSGGNVSGDVRVNNGGISGVVGSNGNGNVMQSGNVSNGGGVGGGTVSNGVGGSDGVLRDQLSACREQLAEKDRQIAALLEQSAEKDRQIGRLIEKM